MTVLATLRWVVEIFILTVLIHRIILIFRS